jgi:hypothetical protein
MCTYFLEKSIYHISHNNYNINSNINKYNFNIDNFRGSQQFQYFLCIIYLMKV